MECVLHVTSHNDLLLFLFILSWRLEQTELMDITMGYIAHVAIHPQLLRIRQSSCVGMAMETGPLDLIQQLCHQQSHLEVVNIYVYRKY